MNVYFDFLIKASVSIGIMYVLYWLLLRNLTHFKANRYFLLASVILAVICAAFPVRYEVLMSAPLQVMQSSEFADQFQRKISNTTIVQEESFPFGIWEFLLGAYLIGFVMVLLRLIVQSWKPVQIILRTNPKKIDDYLLHENTVYKMPFSFFNRILIHPEYFKQNEINDILTHEKVHIQERHWIDLFIIELLTVFFWFNPFIWLFERAIKQNHEYLADKGVLSRGQSPVRYQALLINQLMGTKVIGMANHLNFALGPTRFKMMTKEKCSKRKLYRMIWLLPVLALLMYSFAQPEYKVQAQEKKETKTVTIPDNKELEHTLADGTVVTINGGTTLTYPVKSTKNKEEVTKDDKTNFDVSDSKVPFKVKNKKGNINTLSNVEKPKTSKKVPARIKGTVKDEKGNPIQGASVILKGSKEGSITDSEGNYEFELPAEGEHGLIAMHAGYEMVSNTINLKSTKGADWKHDFIMTAVDSNDKKDKQKVFKAYGTVVDEAGNPMPGAAIIVQGTTLGTVADRDGTFKLEIPTNKDWGLIVSFVGYRTISNKVELKGDKTDLKFEFVLKREVIKISSKDLKNAGDVPPPPPPPAPQMEKSDEPVFVIVEDMPQYPQGFYGLAQHVKKQSAKIKESFFFEGKTLKGNATIGFTVNPKGEVSNIQILKKSNEVAAEAAQIIASKMEAWKPGSQRGKKVPVDFAMELEF
ncbi:carboxypeptidase-like regulatory domain-containing protein [Marinifilum fragile]|uniref:carboxypeptidase-like regulatory domain-containing protein n=1 Tax=Marinifilum fragile TaxID=570161 RepID=UPI0006CFB079|nr:carboxypeptidase-like regulatory domain-containing protein [Marinifilum fragile]